MTETSSPENGRGLSLSAKLLILTVSFVMLAEVLIWTPSVARFRKAYIEDFVARAYLSMLALNSMPETQPNQDLENMLLQQTQALAIIVNIPDRRMLMVGGDMPPSVDFTVDLRTATFMELTVQAFDTLLRRDNRVIRAIGVPPRHPEADVEVLFDEEILRRAMLDFSVRIFNLSLIISLITAAMVYITLQWMIVRPIKRLTDNMVDFRGSPEDVGNIIPHSERSDEIGVAQTELAEMQRQVQASLKQKDRLAALGGAMAKINHDLRNTLATAVLVSDKLQFIEDPEVKRVTPRLMKAIDRAIDLCSQTLNYATEDALQLRPRKFFLRDLVEEIESTLVFANDEDTLIWRVDIDPELEIVADRRHLLRGLNNLCSNAAQAGARELAVRAETSNGSLIIEVSDNGPGLGERALENLFKPFIGSSRKGGTGLGLVIVREIMTAHGGDITLMQSSEKGAAFRIVLPTDIPVAEASSDF